METAAARFGGEAAQYYDWRTTTNSSVEWDPNHWKWDGDLFIATPLNNNPTTRTSKQLFPLSATTTTTLNGVSSKSNSSSSCSEELIRPHNGVRDLEKKRRANAIEPNINNNDNNVNNLSLNLGGEFGAGKKTKLAGQSHPNRAVCQVEGCAADLSKAKDYHRRHKVCEIHSKATKALVANQMQRFCQQCSRFHSLQEFDEGKRSCRRRLAGHNKRRRKPQPESVNNNSSGVVNDNQTSSYLLMTVLKILSNMHSNKSNQTDDQDLLSHLLKSLASQGSHSLINNLNLLGNSELAATLLSNGSLGKRHCPNELPRKDEELQVVTSERPNIMVPVHATSQIYSEERETSGGRSKLNDFDLNDVYVDSDDGMDDTERSTGPLDLRTVSVECPSWAQQESRQSSPPQTSGNSDSASAQSPSSSSGDGQSRTDRIVFKLFGKEPSDFPIVLRSQIFDWLSHSPTDIESYIRPGCVVLTMYLRQSDSAWEELSYELKTSLSRLLDFCDDVTFWSTGWIYIRVPNQMAFVYDGRLVVDASSPFRNDSNCTILSVKPIAVPSSEGAQFVVKGYNLVRPSTRLLFALEGNYLEATSQSVEHADGPEGHGVQFLNFSCTIPAINGRGFIEVDDDGLSNSFFPFIVAEDDVCTEIRMLEKEIDSTETEILQQENRKSDARNQAMEFIHELGWLLHKFQSSSRFEHGDPNLALYSFERFKHLIEFSMDRDWCAVVKKLLDILFQGIVTGEEQPFLKLALSEIGLLHRAVRRNSKSLVSMLLTYVPEKIVDELSLEYKSLIESEQSFLFRPDFAGPGGLTPLHVAAGRDGSDEILDVLIDDPGKVGIAAWKSSRDSAGFTPEDYARLRGHYSYIHLVQRKMNKRLSSSGHVIVDISEPYSDMSMNEKPDEVSTFEITRPKTARISQPCGVCDKKLGYRTGSRTLVYKPVMLSMLAIAAVCVCVALLFKSSPQVLFVFRPFSWEMLEYGSY